jgi:hypothetical protein
MNNEIFTDKQDSNLSSNFQNELRQNWKRVAGHQTLFKGFLICREKLVRKGEHD